MDLSGLARLEVLTSAWAFLAAVFTLVALVRLSTRRRRIGSRPLVGLRPHAAPGTLRVLLLRPMDAAGPGELENLSAGQLNDSDLELEHVVLSPFRPRLPPGVRWLPSDPTTPNRKVGHLCYALGALPVEGRYVLAVDSDVQVDANLVRALVAALERGAELAVAVPLPELQGPSSVGARAAQGLLGATHQSFAAVAAMSFGAPAVCGKALGLGPVARCALAQLGAIAGEDLALAERITRCGGRIEYVDVPARTRLAPQLSVSDAVARFARWMVILKTQRPELFATVPLLFCATPLLAVLTWLGGGALGLKAIGALVLLRTALAFRLLRHPRAFPGWVLGELLLLAAWCVGLVGSRIRWRGNTFELTRGGRMRRVVAERMGFGVS